MPYWCWAIPSSKPSKSISQTISQRTSAAIILTSRLGPALTLAHGLMLILLIIATVVVLDWAMALAQRKGYSPWLGLLLVTGLNLPGIIVLALLPVRFGAIP